jgi:hypothetical protein
MGRWETEGRQLTENYYANFKSEGGGLLLATDDETCQAGINALNDRLGLAPFQGVLGGERLPVDTRAPLMSFPHALGADLPGDSTAARAPFGWQPGGLILYRVAWADDAPDTAAVSSTFRGGQGFRVRIVSPADGGSFNEEVPIRFRAQAEDGTAPVVLEWRSDVDGPLGEGEELTRADLTPGVHHIMLRGTDATGAADAASVQVTVRFVAPAVTAGLAAGSDTGRFANDNLTTRPAPEVAVTINKRGALEVDWEADGGVDVTQPGLAAGTHLVASPEVAPGEHPVRVRFTPLRGEPVETAFTFTVDTRGPRVTEIVPAPGASLAAVWRFFDVTFDDAVDPGSFTVADVTLTGPAGAVTPTDIQPLSDHQFRVRLPGARVNGAYALALGPAIADVAGNLMDQNGNGTPGEPADAFSAGFTVALPDLALEEWQLPPDAVAGQPLTVTWSVRNDGAAPAPAPWRLRLFLAASPDDAHPRELARFTVADALPAGGALSGTRSVILPAGVTGTYYLGWDADVENAVEESNKANNRRLAAAPVELRAPDLVVEAVRLPAASFAAGQTLTVRWVTRNRGSARAAAAWSDRLFLARAADSLADAAPLGTASAPGPLDAGAAYTNHLDVTLPFGPAWPAGDYFLVVTADHAAAQPESDEGNNRGHAPLSLTLPPLPDLLAQAVVVPDTALPGGELTVIWQVTNAGPAAVDAGWHERLAISNALQGWRALAELAVTNRIESGGALWRTQAVTLPPDLLAGEQWFRVTTDSRDEIREEDDGNNAGVSATAAVAPARLELSLPVTRLAEGAPAIPARVSRNSDPAAALTVTLSGDAPAELALPDHVTLPAGKSAVTFEVTALADGVVDPDALVRITAAAPGHAAATAELTVLNVDVPALELTLAGGALIEGGALEATVRRSARLDQPLTVRLANSQPVFLETPDTVTLPAGVAEQTFPLAAPEDDLLTGPIPVEIQVSAPGFRAARATLEVLDNDLPLVTLTVEPASVAENAPPGSVSGTVTREPVSARPLVVDLVNSDPSELQTPPRVVIPANRASATFLLAPVDDDALDGAQTVTVTPWLTASGSGARLQEGVAATLEVTDDEGPALRIVLPQGLAAEGLAPAFTAAVYRNTPPDAPLAVALASSDSTEATVPAGVTIPAGADHVEFPVTTLEDGVPDGNQTVTLSAAADGFAPGRASLVVSDTDLPDLVAGPVQLPATADAESYFTLTYRVRNQGLGPATGGFDTLVYLSRDAVKGDD